MDAPNWLKYPYAELGTPITIGLAFLIYSLGRAVIKRRIPDCRAPKQRRPANNFIWQRTFERLRSQPDITIASQTSDAAIHWQAAEPSSSGPPPA